MRRRLYLIAISIIVGQTAVTSSGQTPPNPTSTPAEYKINAAREAIAKNSKYVAGYNDLATAFIGLARETANSGFYDDADNAVKTALRLSPGNFETLKVKVQVLLGKHDFDAARVEAEKLNKLVPDDVPVYGLIADADIALGDYADAEKQVQWMLTLRQDTAPAMDRVAQLRELFGDLDGAMDALRIAMSKTPPSESEQVASMLTRYAHLCMLTGQLKAAESACDEALQTFPGYHAALRALADIRSVQQRYGEAVEILKQCELASPTLATRFELAVALQRDAKQPQAKSEFEDFARKAREQIALNDNDNVDLVRYDLEFGRNPGEALAVSRQEMDHRHDVWTLDAYARALAANGNAPEARKQLQRALEVGVKEPGVNYDAGIIENLLDDRNAARGYFEKVIAAGETSVYYAQAEKALAQLALSASEIKR